MRWREHQLARNVQDVHGDLVLVRPGVEPHGHCTDAGT